MGNLNKKLDEALYPMPMRLAVRNFRHRITLKEATEPIEGIYWWVPFPTKKGVEWRVVPFYESEIGYKDHSGMWHHILKDLSEMWGFTPGPELRSSYTALPRGRIVKKQKHGYVLYHGNDAPADMTKALEAFKLVLGGNNEAIFDFHEQMISGEPEELQKAMGVDLGIRSKVSLFGDDDDTDDFDDDGDGYYSDDE